MKVTGQQPPRTSELTTGQPREAERKPGRVQKEQAEAKPAQRSRTSLAMSRIKEAIRNTPDVRADRVAALQKKIRSGTFKVDAERLAENLLNESLREDLEKP